MSNEKMMILNMVQEGTITADEATKLLAAVESNTAENTTFVPPKPTSPPEAVPVSNNNTSAPRPAARSSGIDFDELGRKFATFAKDLEPKIQKATEIIAEKTVTIADKISKSIESGARSLESKSLDHDALPRMPEKSYTAPSTRVAASTGTGTEQQIEMMVEDGYNELNLSGLNNIVHIKGYNGDKISARIRYKAKRMGSSVSSIELMKLGAKYYLKYEEDDFDFVAIDAYVPSHKFKVINISGINGNMEITGIDCQDIKISSGNGQMTLKDLKAETIESESSNGRLTIVNVNAKQAVFEHFNGIVDAGEIDAEKLSLTNSNGTLSLSVSGFRNFNEYLWNVETSNAKLNLNVPTMPSLGYHIRAQAPLGDIKIGLTGLSYLINDPSFAEAKTSSFASCTKRVQLALETSGATLMVN